MRFSCSVSFFCFHFRSISNTSHQAPPKKQLSTGNIKLYKLHNNTTSKHASAKNEHPAAKSPSAKSSMKPPKVGPTNSPRKMSEFIKPPIKSEAEEVVYVKKAAILTLLLNSR